MYMAPIVRAKSEVSAPVRRLVGIVVLLIAAVVMLPWLAGYALYSGVVLGIRGLVDMVDYAGTVALGR